MSINKFWPLMVIGLFTACTSTEEQEKIVYVEPEQMVLNRSAQDRAATLTELGYAYYKLEKYSYAEEYLLRSLELDKNNATSYQVFALIEQRGKNP
ncbi:tetratricopeptide repeat protein [Bathymodiolus japonicus methanotrophic gill symbiont]|uniref:tetratricopeptide repeat protein n=1 Tax=Bathymodiolus japonicus methanotrophic gill symbiont TaxID=113269 RepID=UPI001C8D1E7E|nr:tetratricopeptide repeat protein [Bathymodiolus japonicus methanotrophic gill symbiont]